MGKKDLKLTVKQTYRNLLIYFSTGMPQEGMPLGQGFRYERLPVLVCFPYQRKRRRIFRYNPDEGSAQEINLESVINMILDFTGQFEELHTDSQYCLTYRQAKSVANDFLKDWCTPLKREPSIVLISKEDLGEPWCVPLTIN